MTDTVATDKNTKTDIFKTVVRFVIASSVGWTTTNVIKNNTTADKRRHKAEAYIGGAVIGSMAADAAGDYSDRLVDIFVDAYRNGVVIGNNIAIKNTPKK